MSRTRFRVDGVTVTFEGKESEFKAISDVSLTLEPSEFVSILGPSGSGKSTLLRLLAGVLEPSAGVLRVQQGDDPERIWRSEEASPKRALVFQNSNLLPWMSVLENVTLPLRVHGVNRDEARQRGLDWLAKVGLPGVENEWPETLSGGMAQRVAIARALIQEPELLLLDEPFGALDALTRETLSDELLRTWETVKPTVLLVTHSVSEAVFLSDRVLVFSPPPGRVTAEVKIELPRPRRAELRYDPAFVDMTRQLRAMIGKER